MLFHPYHSCNQLRTCMPMPSVRLIFSFLVLSNVASKLQWTNLPLNKAKTSKNRNHHLLFSLSHFGFRTSNFLRNARIQLRTLRLAVLRLCIVSLRVVLDLLSQTVRATQLFCDLSCQILCCYNLR